MYPRSGNPELSAQERGRRDVETVAKDRPAEANSPGMRDTQSRSN